MKFPDRRTPFMRRFLAATIQPMARICDKIYRSEYNPLYRSGTLAIGMLLVLLVTGIYLLFFYNVASPYASIERIQAQAWLGRWIRAMHRYATDLAIVATVFHILQIMIQGRSWGPRILAWISGMLLLGALMVSAWTGYVMVWDQHGQWLAVAGARLGAAVPFMHDTVSRTFSGAQPITGSFFFLNLFLHVAIPLVMVIGIWIHTAHLAKPRWLPHTATFVPLVLALFLVSIFYAAPMVPEADLLRLPGRMAVDLFTSFWLPLVHEQNSAVFGAALGLVILVVAAIPWWWPGNRKTGPAMVDTDACIGCARCFRDCPFEAITMKPREDGTRLLLSVVDESRCVECGLCVASCSDNAITLPGMSLGEQVTLLDEVCPPGMPLDESLPVVVYCGANPGIDRTIARLRAERPGLLCHSVSCAGVLHAEAVAHLLETAPGVLMVTCPGENCANRWGHDLATARMSNQRKPGLSRPDQIDRTRVLALSGHEYRALSAAIGDTKEPTPTRGRVWMRTAIAHTLVILGIALLSAWPLGTDPETSVFRTFLSLPGYTVEHAEAWTEEELQSIPAHMRLKEKITRKPVHYKLAMAVNGQPHQTRQLRARRDGQEVRLSDEYFLTPGMHHITLQLTTDVDAEVRTLYDKAIKLVPGEVHLFEFDGKSLWAGDPLKPR